MARNEKRADYCFEKALLLAPQSWFAHWLASRIRYFYQKFALALKLAQQALALDSARASVWLQLGQCQEALGMISLAQASFDHALQLNPHCSEARKGLAGLKPVGWLASFRAQLNGLFSR